MRMIVWVKPMWNKVQIYGRSDLNSEYMVNFRLYCIKNTYKCKFMDISRPDWPQFSENINIFPWNLTLSDPGYFNQQQTRGVGGVGHSFWPP